MCDIVILMRKQTQKINPLNNPAASIRVRSQRFTATGDLPVVTFCPWVFVPLSLGQICTVRCCIHFFKSLATSCICTTVLEISCSAKQAARKFITISYVVHSMYRTGTHIRCCLFASGNPTLSIHISLIYVYLPASEPRQFSLPIKIKTHSPLLLQKREPPCSSHLHK